MGPSAASRPGCGGGTPLRLPGLRHEFHRSARRDSGPRAHDAFRGLVDGAFRVWEREILAYFDVRIRNAYAEGITNKIKVIKRSGYGSRNFARFRERVLVQRRLT